MERRVRWSVGALVGTALGAGSFVFLVPDWPLSASLAFVWAVGVALAIRLNRHTSTGGEFERGRWTALSVLVALVPANLGLWELDITGELRLAFGLLVIGVGFAAFLAGVALMVEKGIVSGGDVEAEPVGGAVEGAD